MHIDGIYLCEKKLVNKVFIITRSESIIRMWHNINQNAWYARSHQNKLKTWRKFSVLIEKTLFYKSIWYMYKYSFNIIFNDYKMELHDNAFFIFHFQKCI